MILWQPGKPYLYQVTARFGEDVYTMTYGVRTVEVKGGKFLINGRPFYSRATESTRIPSRRAGG